VFFFLCCEDKLVVSQGLFTTFVVDPKRNRQIVVLLVLIEPDGTSRRKRVTPDS